MKKEEKKPRRGRMMNQASAESYTELGGPHDRAKVAKFGRDYTHFLTYLNDCKIAAMFCPDQMPALPEDMEFETKQVLELGWRMVHALKKFKREDRIFLERMLTIRGGHIFPQFISGKITRPADALRTALCRLANEQEEAALTVLNILGTRQPKKTLQFRLKTVADIPLFLREKCHPKTAREIGGWLAMNAPECSTPSEKTIRQACKDAGVILANPGAQSQVRYINKKSPSG
jgi:hypothetical protein